MQLPLPAPLPELAHAPGEEEQLTEEVGEKTCSLLWCVGLGSNRREPRARHR
jgi:hypothetical protein